MFGLLKLLLKMLKIHLFIKCLYYLVVKSNRVVSSVQSELKFEIFEVFEI